MQWCERAIFVLDVLKEGQFAFEAVNLAQAEDFARSPWFLQSVRQFFSQHGRGCQAGFTARTRPATEAEVLRYRILADEFAETSGYFFVAHLCADK